MGKCKVDFESMEWESSADGVRFKAYEQDGRKLRLVEFSKDFVETDWCTKGHIGYILEGKVEIDFNGDVIVFDQGDGLFILAGEKHRHKARVLTDKVKAILIEDGM